MTPELHRQIVSYGDDVSNREVARLAGVAEATVRRWRSRPYPHHEYLENSRRITPEAPKESRFRFEPEPEVEGVLAGDDGDFEEVYRRAVYDFRQRDTAERRKAAQSIAFESGPVCLVFAADQHFGGRGTDVKRAFSEAEVVRDTPGMFAFLVGDVCDSYIIPKLARVRHDSRLSIPDEWTLAKHYLQRFERKLLAVVSGNHDNWTHALSGIDYHQEITPNGVLYDRDEITVDARVGRYTYKIIARHRWKGNSMYNPFHPQTRGAKFNRPGHDIYVGAHTHSIGGYADHPHGGKRIGLVQCGTYKIHDDYQRSGNFPSAPDSTAVAVILTEDGRFWGMADVHAAAFQMREIYRRAA